MKGQEVTFFFIKIIKYFFLKIKLDFIQLKLFQLQKLFIIKILFIGIFFNLRDVKLENVAIASNGHIKLLDYGLAKPNMKINNEA